MNQIKSFYDPATFTLTYVVFDPDLVEVTAVTPCRE